MGVDYTLLERARQNLVDAEESFAAAGDALKNYPPALKALEKTWETIKGDFLRALNENYGHALDSYLSTIKVGFGRATPEEKDRILGGLESLLKGLTAEKEEQKEAEEPNKQKPKEEFTYNPKKAKKIREQAGFSQRALAEELGLSPEFSSNICKYEKGVMVPSSSYPSKTGGQKSILIG